MTLRLGKALSLLLALMLGLSGCAGQVNPPAKPPLQALVVARSPAFVPTDGSATEGIDGVVANYQAYLKSAPPGPNRDLALRRYADLLIVANERRVVAGQPPVQADYDKAIAAYQELLPRTVDAAKHAEILYQLARIYQEQGKTQATLATWQKIETQHPASKLTAEVAFRRAETLFDQEDFLAAAQAYSVAIAGLSSASSLYLQSYYKRAWSRLNEGRNEEAADDFLQVLDLTLSPTIRRLSDVDSLPGAKRKQAQDTLHALGIALSPGADSTGGQYFKSRQTRTYQALLYEALADFYVKKERISDAANVYTAFSDHYPNDPLSPIIAGLPMGVYEKAGFHVQARAARERYVNRYAPDAEYWKNRPHDAAVIAEVKQQLLLLIQYYHAASQKEKVRQGPLFAQAESWYQVFLRGYLDDPQAPHVNFLLAELRYDAGLLALSAKTYERTAYEFLGSADGSEAAYAAIQGWDQQIAGAETVDKSAARKGLISSARLMLTHYPDHPKIGLAVQRAAEESLALGDQKAALQLSLAALSRQIDPEIRERALMVAGSSAFNLKDYATAEKAYQEALTLASSFPSKTVSAEQRQDLVDRLASSVYQQGEQARQAGQYSQAADNFERLYALAPGSRYAVDAQYDAAAAHVDAGESAQAIPLLEQFRARNPQHRLHADAEKMLIQAYLKTDQPGRAAHAFEALAHRSSEAPVARQEALWQAVNLYTKAGDNTGVTRCLTAYIEQYKRPTERVFEAMHRLVDSASTAGDLASTSRWQARMVTLAKESGTLSDRERVWVAQSALALAQPKVTTFSQAKLTIPFKDSLTRKKRLLEVSLAALNEAKSYQVAEVTTEAVFRTGEIYENFGQSLQQSERPSLAPDELIEYDAMLEEQAFGFEEKAIEIYTDNANRVNDGIYDEWVRRSMDRLAKLFPARYGKVEQHANVIEITN